MEAGSFFIHKPSRLFLQPDPPDAILLGRDMLRLQAAGIDGTDSAHTEGCCDGLAADIYVAGTVDLHGQFTHIQAAGINVAGAVQTKKEKNINSFINMLLTASSVSPYVLAMEV